MGIQQSPLYSYYYYTKDNAQSVQMSNKEMTAKVGIVHCLKCLHFYRSTVCDNRFVNIMV